MHPRAPRLATLLGSASLMTLAGTLAARAGEAQVAQAAPVEAPEQVLITGSLIRGTAAVGVPVTNLGPQDFRQTGALTASDLFRTIPQFNVIPGPVGTLTGNTERGTRVNLRSLDTPSAPRALMMIDGVRYPPQSAGLCQLDPSIIPNVAIERVDLLMDGASATYGSDAIGGVVNIILKRAYDGAVTEMGYTVGSGGNQQFQASQLWGRTWDGGDITLGYEWRDVAPTHGTFHSKYTFDQSPWGLDNRIPIGSSMPGTISTGAPASRPGLNPDSYAPNVGSNCANCWAIPAGTGGDFNPINGGIGPTSRFSASTLNWATFNVAGNSGTNGTRNVFNPYEVAYYSAGIQYNGAFLTVDQRLTSNITFYGTGFYGMRRATFYNHSTFNQLLIAVPTFNPYYPTGGAPTNLRVAYNTNIEQPSYTNAWAAGMRYMGGLRIELPGDWAADAYYAQTRDAEFNRVFGQASKFQVSAALGWTLPVTPASGDTPAIATWTKPATVPYLNLFCDPKAFQCNSATTLNYIVGNYDATSEHMNINEKGIKADGPLFDLPGGQVKAAIGANYTTYHFLTSDFAPENTNPTLSFVQDPRSRQVWAVFTQINVPLVGDANALPGIRRLDLEGSWRHDQYSDFGGTSNAKFGFNWGVSDDLGLTLRGSWGQSFRAPNFGETSEVANINVNAVGLPSTVFVNTAQFIIGCDPATGRPTPGSAAEKLFNAGFACGSQPPGIWMGPGGGAANAAHLRDFYNTEQRVLDPEKAVTWSLGLDLAPVHFLPGLDIQVTWYSIKITNILRIYGGPSNVNWNNGILGSLIYMVPSDVGCPKAQDSTPWLCANFQTMVAGILANPNNAIPPEAQTLIYWVQDNGTMNRGWQKNTGYDFTVSYDWDAGEIGTFNTGITGTYYEKQQEQSTPTSPILDFYHTTIDASRSLIMHGVESRPRLKYRARLGWANGPWNVTGFVDYEAHFFNIQTSPPNVNNNCVAAGGTIGGGTFPCLINDYTNIQPPYYTFDLSIGYDTGDIPANEFLRNIGIQLLVQNAFDRVSPHQYRVSTVGGQPCACDILKSLYGRRLQLRIVKTW